METLYQNVRVSINKHDMVAWGSVRTDCFPDKLKMYWKIYQSKKNIDLINELINYLYVSKQETELLIPAQSGNRTIKMYTSSEWILSVDHWPSKRKDMQLTIDYFNDYDDFNYSNYFNYFNHFNYFNYFN